MRSFGKFFAILCVQTVLGRSLELSRLTEESTTPLRALQSSSTTTTTAPAIDWDKKWREQGVNFCGMLFLFAVVGSGAFMLKFSDYIKSPDGTVFVPDVIDFTCDDLEGTEVEKSWVVPCGDDFETKQVKVRMYNFVVTIEDPEVQKSGRSSVGLADFKVDWSVVSGERDLVCIRGTTQHKKTVEDVLEARMRGEKIPTELLRYKKYAEPSHVRTGPHCPRPIEDSQTLTIFGEKSKAAGWQIEAIGLRNVARHVRGTRYSTTEGKAMVYASIPRWASAILYIVLIFKHWPQHEMLVAFLLVFIAVDMLVVYVFREVLIKQDAAKLATEFPALAVALAEYDALPKKA